MRPITTMQTATMQTRTTNGDPSNEKAPGGSSGRPPTLRSRVGAATGSTIAGAIGFAIGFYVGLFIILSIWGLDADAVAFPLITVATGSLVSGGAVAITVSGTAPRFTSVAVAVGTGALVAIVLVAFDGSFEMLVGSGVVIALAASIVARVVESRTH